MNPISNLFELDVSSIIMGIFIFMSSIIAIFEIIGKFLKIIGKPANWIKNKNDDHTLILQTSKGLKDLQEAHEESVRQSIQHDEMIESKISCLTDTVNSIANTLDRMQEKIDDTEMAKLKDKILLYYKRYKDAGEWDQFESEVFWGLYDSYVSHGGNSFIKNEIEPVMRKLDVID